LELIRSRLGEVMGAIDGVCQGKVREYVSGLIGRLGG
jgi:hypothetical protein